jgi:hypothetical protein
MASKTHARDKSSLHLCRIELPNLVDDMQLSVYAFRLYVRIKRVAQDEGSCWQSARTLAAACCMSPGQVSKAKEELARRGLIVRQTKTVRGGQVDDITIVDIWPENFRKYARESDHGANTSPESDRTANTLAESDHSTIASIEEVITPRSLNDESDHEVIGLSIKRSHSDRKNHVGDDGGGRTLAFLIDQGIGSADEFAHLPYESMIADYEARAADKQTKAMIVKAWRSRPPTETYHYERRSPSENRPARRDRNTASASPPVIKLAKRDW